MPRNDYFGNDPNEMYEGFTINLIEELARRLNFKYRIYRSPNNRYGADTGNGVWDGMVGEVMAGVSRFLCMLCFNF